MIQGYLSCCNCTDLYLLVAMPADLYDQLHIGIVEYGFRRIWDLPTMELEWQYDDLPTDSSQNEVFKFVHDILRQCRHSMLVHITLYLDIGLQEFLSTMPGMMMERRLEESIADLGNWCYAGPWSTAWIHMKCLTNFVFVCLGPEFDEDPEDFNVQIYEAASRGQVSMLHDTVATAPNSDIGFAA